MAAMEYRMLTDEEGFTTYALIFAAGDEAMTELRRFAKETGISGASFSGVVGASRSILGWFDFTTSEFEPTLIDEQVEVVSVLGDVATTEDGAAQVHAHVVVAKRGAHAYGGHLIEMNVNPTLEIMLTETPTHLRKRSVPGQPFSTIRLAESG